MTLVLFSALSFASASDLSDNLTDGGDQNTIKVANIQQNILGDGQKTFDQLDKVINNDSIPEYGTVELDSDYTFSDSDIFTDGISISKSITIDGKGHILNASNKASIFKINNNAHVILKNIVFTNGNASDGGAIYVDSGSSFEIRDCTFSDNFAHYNGGAIFLVTDNLTSQSVIINSIFTNNVAANGGAVYASSSALTVTLSDFSHNSVSGNGGSLFINGVANIAQTTFDYDCANVGGSIYLMGDSDIHSTIDFSTFKNCNSTGDGGACYINSSGVTVKNTKFFDNVAGDDGGALYWEGSNGIIDNITSTNNRGISIDKGDNDTSSTRGGAICLTGSHVTLSKSTFTNCIAYMDDGKDSSKVDGGAVFATGNGVIISDVTFTGCNAINNGGALYVIGNETQIIKCTFENSNAKDGAALFVNGNDCKLYNSTFTNNIAADDGGAIYWEGDNGLMYNIICTNNKGISFNTSSSRGGTICLTGDNVTVAKSSFSSSEAYIDEGKDSSKVDGGALFITGNDVNIIDTEFNDCKAVNRGGAIYILGNSSHVVGCNFTSTQALIGGAIYIEGNDAVVDYSLFRHNTASNKAKTGGSGGAIYVDGNRATISNSDFAYGETINYGGAISVWGANANITKNVFDNCTTTTYYGGSIFVIGENATISLSNFTRSKAQNKFAQGGAIQVSGANAIVDECNFEYCFAYYGGDIYISGVNALVNNSVFKHSTTFKPTGTSKAQSPQWGAAVYVSGEYGNILNSNFTDCTAEEYGGAICIQGANTVINGSHFDKCKAKSGGDIFVFGNNAKIEDSTFNTSSANYGGAIYLTAWGAVIKHANITTCDAKYSGGAIYVAGGGTTIIESNFEKCKASGGSATYGGGALYMAGSYNNIIGSNFNDNGVTSVNARGGTIYISSGEGTNIQKSYFNNSYAGNGGIIFMEGNKVIISTSTFANSSSRYYGGAISIQGHNATIQDSTFENFNSNNGGAIYVDGESTNILRSSFDNCTANSKGGAININDVGTTVAYSNFTLSHALTGGAIHIDGENTTVTYCNLEKNTASTAGAIQISGANTLISNTNLTHNKASTAGAIKVTGSNTLISDCNLTYNIAYGSSQGSGGAMDISGQNASVRYSNFDHNDARLYGGAINWDGGHGEDSIIGTTFTFNNCNGSGLGGGAVYWTAGNGQIGSGGLIKDSIFINNSASGHHGGAIDWFHALNSVIDNCLFINNYASADGGALYTGDKNGNSYNFTISNSQFYNNTAGKHGGAIANQMTNCLIYNNTFDGNSAKHGGGTILMKEAGGTSPGGTNSTIDHCYIYNTYCDIGDSWAQSGGAIQIGASDKNITISNCAIINASCYRSYGGAISMASPDSSLINVTIQNVETRDGYGGAVYWSGARGTFDNVTIFNSSSTAVGLDRSADGGAIFLSGSNCNLNNITITTSSSNIQNSNIWRTDYGGAIYVSGADNTLTNVNIDDSKALAVRMNTRGGAIYWEGARGTLINATISNTLTNGQGGAIYWSGSSPTVENISIEYSRTNVTSSSNTADGGAIYSTTINNLKNVYIVDSIASRNSGDVKGGAIYYNGLNMDNVTVIGSRASTDSGTTYGGAIYWVSSGNGNLYNSTFENNTADLGGAVFSDRTTSITGTTFEGNVAIEGGALYGRTGADTISNSIFELNSAKRGGAIFVQKVNFFIDDSTLINNTAEEKGGAIYRNHNGASYIRNSDLANNTAFQGSAIYTVTFFELTNVTLLDNQANSKEFIEKAVGVDEKGNNYTSGVFVGFDNLLNAIWDEEKTVSIKCNNVTYWGVNGINVSDSIPVKSDREVWQNVTVEMFNGDGVKINETVVVTDANGRFKYIFDAKDGETYFFAYTHKTDRYYTYLRESMSNSSLVKVYVYNPIYYNQNQTILISLTDGAWGEITGNVTVEIKGPITKTFEIEIINGTWTDNISGLPLGDYNVTASFAGDLNHTGDTDWAIFTVLPYVDLDIIKDVNITADLVNVSDVIKYTINITNHGPSNATGVYVLEDLSPYLRLIKNETNHGYYDLTNGTWYIGDLDIDEVATLTIIAEVIHMGPITNTVWAYGDGNDTNLTNNVASARNFTAVPIIDLHIVKEVNVTKNTINVLDEIKFIITVFNYGPCNATGVYVRENLDDHLGLVSYHTSDGSLYKNGTWHIGNLANGTNVTLTIVAKVIYSGNITNDVAVYGFENETNYTNNYDSIKNITSIANVDVGIIKTVNVTGYVNVTDLIEFNITVYNNGPCNASGVYVEEVLDSHLELVSYNTTDDSIYDGYTWVIGRLSSGETVNLNIVARVTSSGTIANAVVVKSIDNDTNTSNNNDTIDNITSLNIVDLDITKEVTKGGRFVNVTDEIEFKITVTNHGPCDATNVTVSEVLNSHISMIYANTRNGYYNVGEGIWHIDTLTNGSTAVLTIGCRVISKGIISNFVFVTSNENDTNMSNNNDTIDDIISADALDLKITKTSNITSGVVNVTDYIKYTITVHNYGPSNATGVNVTEALGPYLRLDKSITGYGNYDVNKGIWYIGNLTAGSTVDLTLVCEVIGNGTIDNVVVVTCNENDTNPNNNRDELIIFSNPIVDLRIVKTVNVNTTEIDVNVPIQFTVTVFNDGPSNATGVYVQEPLNPRLSMINYTTSDGSAYDGYTWVIGDLASGSNVTLVITAQVAYSGAIENFVIVFGNEIDTNMSNNYDNITNITAFAHVDVGVNKTVNVTTGVVNVSDLIEFNITVYNNGPCNASGVIVVEALDYHLEFVSYNTTNNSTYDGYSWNVGNVNVGEPINLTIVARVVSEGIFSNFVSVVTYDNDTNPDNDNDTIDNITALPVVDLEIIKEVTFGGSVVNVSDIVQFSITVINNGPCDATNVTVSEVLSPHLEMTYNSTWIGYYDVNEGIWHIGTLEKRTNVTLIIQAKVISDGIISNFVSVNSTENDTNTSNNNDTIDNITALPIVDLEITKTSNITSGAVNVTDYIEYTITVHNNGPSNATGVNVTEDLGSYLRLVKNETAYGYYDVNKGIWYIGELNNGFTVNLTLVCQVIGQATTIDNVVVVTSYENDTNPYNNRDELIIVSNSFVDLRIVKTVNITATEIDVNDVIQFNVTVFNDGPCNATGVFVLEPLSPILEMINYTTSDGSAYDGYTWVIGNLGNDDSVTLLIVAKVAYSGAVENFVTVFGNEKDTNESNNKANVTNITARTNVDMGVIKTVNVTVVNVTDYIEFTITVYNNGSSDATGVVVAEALDSHLNMISYSTTDNSTYDGYSWNVGNVNAGESVNLTIIAQVISQGIFSNFVSVICFENDTNPDNDNYTIDNITALPIVDLEIEKTVSINTNTVYISDVIVFVITVRNNGPCDATGVNVTEVLNPHLRMVSYSTWMGNYSVDNGMWYIGDLPAKSWVSLIITTQVISGGVIDNVVVVTSNENDTNPDNNNDSIDNITAIDAVDLEIAKSVDVKDNTVYIGEVIEFTIRVQNNGICNATGVNVTEVLSPHIRMIANYTSKGYYSVNDAKWYVGDLAVGEEALLVIKAQVISEGIIENVVFVTSNENDTDPDDNNASIDNITAIKMVDVSVVKTVSVTQAHVGDEISYTITVHNSGPNDATNVNVTEKLSDYVTLVKADASIGHYDSTDAIWYIGKLNNGSTQTLTLKVKLISEGIVENVVSINSTENDTNTTNNNYTCDNVTVNRVDTPIDLYTYNITYGEDEILVVTLPSDVSGTVNITVSGVTYNDVLLNNGVATLLVCDLGGGDYTVDVIYGGDYKYLPNSTSGKFTVLPVVPIIKIEVVDIWVGEVEVLNVTVNAPGTVNITVYGRTIEVPLNESVTTTDVLKAFKTEYNGKATWNLVNLPAGKYLAFAIYNGNENYTSVNTSDTFIVKKLPSTVSVTAKDIYVGEDAIIKVKVGPSDVTGKVTITVDGRKYTADVKNGSAEFVVHGLKAGTKEVTVSYSGDDKYLSSKNSTTFKVKKYHPPIDSTTQDIEYGKDETIVVHLPEDATGKVTIIVDGKKYTEKVEDGKATFKIPGLMPGKYDVKVYYSGNGKYYSAKTTNDFKVTQKSTPNNNGTNGTTNKGHGGIDLTKNQTGNPVLLLLLLFATGSISCRRFKK